jgi:RNA polymerase sigma-70 factor (ECF subfamily)
MSQLPDTRASLIRRLADRSDADAWEQFAVIYQPLVYRLARRRGLQDADAHELVQDVMVAVSRAVERWNPDPQRGRFRDWLFRIARNLILNYLTRPKYRTVARGGSLMDWLDEHPAPNAEASALFDLEYRREVFRWATEHVQRQVQARTWEAFWLSTVEDQPIPSVAAELNMTIGSVYIARSRVMARLREAIHNFENLGANDS